MFLKFENDNCLRKWI